MAFPVIFIPESESDVCEEVAGTGMDTLRAVVGAFDRGIDSATLDAGEL